MGGALVRGGVGSEIALRDILPPHLRSGLATRSRTEPIAREYEAKNPGSVVVCDWELFDDADIAVMTPEGRQQAMMDRNALAERRAAAAKMTSPKEASRGGDPERVRELLRRARNEIARLDITAPSYPTRFADLARQINQFEDAIGAQRTEFKLNKRYDLADTLTPEQKKAYSAKVKRYTEFPKVNRRASVNEATDPILTRMLFDVENEPDLKEALALKLAELATMAPV